MKKKIFIFLFFFLLFVLGVLYTYFFRPIVDDEFYNFGFAKNILEGYIPYLDFNMIIPPFFSYFLGLFLFVFGKKLIVYHCLLSLLVVGITYLAYRRIGFFSICFYFLALIYPFTGYNTFCLFLFMLLLTYCEDSKSFQDVFEAILIVLMILSKHTLGILILPCLIFSKHKKKSFCIFLIGGLFLLLYLLLFHNFYEFLDYCVFGMFDFTAKNGGFGEFFFIELFIIIVLIVSIFKYKKKKFAYVLGFQIMAFPSFNYVHFVIAFIPIVYLILLVIYRYKFVSVCFNIFCISFFISFSLIAIMGRGGIHFLNHYSRDGFMKYRFADSSVSYYVDHIDDFLDEYPDYDVYMLGNFAYLVKLNLDIPLNRYDIINNGNMGWHGYQRYIDEIDYHCHQHKCLIFINDLEATGEVFNQVNRDILYYVQGTYYKVYASNFFSVYVN